VGIIAIGLFGYFDINIAAAFLAVALIAEVLLLGALGLLRAVQRRWPDGLVLGGDATR
jgi:hypothetical protein